MPFMVKKYEQNRRNDRILFLFRSISKRIRSVRQKSLVKRISTRRATSSLAINKQGESKKKGFCSIL